MALHKQPKSPAQIVLQDNPDILPGILDYLPGKDLVLLLRVCTSWRDACILNPGYWKHIEYTPKQCRRDEDHVLLLLLPQFERRIDAARARDINITLDMPDPTLLLPTISRHVHHVAYLNLRIPFKKEKLLWASLHTPAPRLKTLILNFLPPPKDQLEVDPLAVDPAVLPTDIFANDAPKLRAVGLSNCTIPDEIPPCFLELQILWLRGAEFRPVILPASISECTALKKLSLNYSVHLDQLDAPFWARLKSLVIVDVPTSDKGYSPWTWPTGALRGVPHVQLVNGDDATTRALVEHVGDDAELILHVSYIEDPDGTFQLGFKQLVGTRKFGWRSLDEQGFDALCRSDAFSRVKCLTVWANAWDEFVAHFPTMPRLVGVHVMLSSDPGKQFSAASKKLPCGKLNYLDLQAIDSGQACQLTAEELSSFMRSALHKDRSGWPGEVGLYANVEIVDPESRVLRTVKVKRR